jgi:hypothetical protein
MYEVLDGEIKGKVQTGRIKQRWQHNTEMCPEEILYKIVD